MKITTLGMKRPGDRINIEFDIIGKYIARRKEDRLTEGFLKEHGFRLG
jgi:riboflavin synthase alpha subunit